MAKIWWLIPCMPFLSGCAVCAKAEIAIPSDRCIDVHTIEYNTWPANRSGCYIFRNHFGEIIDWRWTAIAGQIHRLPEGGWQMAWFEDMGRGPCWFRVRCREYRRTFTRSDQEVEERRILPDWKRVKLH